MTQRNIKDFVNVIIEDVPRLAAEVYSSELPVHSHRQHTLLDADDHLQYMTVTAGTDRPFIGDVYINSGFDIRGRTELRFDDYYRSLYTTAIPGNWTEDGIRLSWNQAEWDELFDNNGGMTSIIGAINSSRFSLSIDELNQRMTGDVRLTHGTNIILDELDDGTGYQISAIIADVKYFCDSVTVTTGVLEAGDHNSTHDWQDGAELQVAEVGGVPGFDIRFYFSGVGGINKVSTYVKYDGGGATHTVYGQLYNNNLTDWTTIGSFTIGPAYEVYEWPIPIDTDYIDGSGNVQFRFWHPESGIALHDLHVDYLAIVRAATSAGGVTDHGSLTGLTDTSDHLWAFLHDGTRAATGDFDMDDNAITEVSYVDFVLNGATSVEGRLRWDTDYGTLALGLPGGNVDQAIGQELPMRSRNESVVSLLNGNATRIVGSTGPLPSIAMASNISHENSCLFGLATEDISSSSYGYVTALGLVNWLNTGSFSPGDTLWLSSSGGWTNVMPDSPSPLTEVGNVISAHATEGSIYVRPRCIPRYSYLPDVNVRDTTLYNGNITAWDETNEYWDVIDDFFLFYNGSDIVLETDTGSLILEDEYRPDSTTFTSQMRIADSLAEWNALGTAMGGPASLAAMLTAALSGGGGTRDAAYDYGGAGAGANITADSGPVIDQNTGQNTVLQVQQTSATPTTTDPVMRIQNNDSSVNENKTLELYGLRGTSDIGGGYGHKIWTTDGAVSFGADYTGAPASEAYLNFYRPVTDDAARAVLTAVGATYESTITATAIGTISIFADASVSIDSEDVYVDAVDTLYLDGDTINIESIDSIIIDAGSEVIFDTPEIDYAGAMAKHGMGSVTFAGNAATFTWDKPYYYLNLTSNCTTVNMTVPFSDTDKCSETLTLVVFANGGARSITGFSGVTWFGSYDPDDTAYTIPAGERVTIFLKYIASGIDGFGGYLGQLVPQP